MTLRRWHLDANAPYSFQLAADARLSLTEYVDDQIWELLLGVSDSPALTLQTKYGGRVGLASLVPMWQIGEKIIYQAMDYTSSPVVTEFAPGYLQAEAHPVPDVSVTAQYWVMESRSVGGYFVVRNDGKSEISIRLDLFGHVAAENKSLPLAVVSLQDGTHALSLGRVKNIEPMIVLENASSAIIPGMKASPKIGTDFTLEPGATQTIRWVHSGLGKMEASLERAQFWLKQDWDSAFTNIKELAQATPDIETGNIEYDAAIAFSYQALLQAFMPSSDALPYASFVATRQPDRGYSTRGDGTDYDRGWNGQSAHLAYLTALEVAPIDPQIAQGIVRNFLSVQNESGWIDAKPGIAGQRQELLCPPLLARLSWEIYQYTQDVAFLAEIFPGLLRFLNCWAEIDQEVEGDIVPQWHDERQVGYTFFPTFAVGQPWSQNLNIQRVESPDMAALLLSEIDSLTQMAEILGDSGVYELRNRREQLNRDLNKFWNEDLSHYVYLDSETHAISFPVTIVEDKRADSEFILAEKLEFPAGLIIRISGGTGKPPRATLQLKGIDLQGNAVTENVDLKSFFWSYSQGVYTTQKVYTQIDTIKFEGLSRVYQVNVSTIDLSRFDINAILPLWFQKLSSTQAALLLKNIMDESHFFRPSGLTIVSAQDANFDPASKNGGGGTWTFWATVIGEGLVAHHYSQHAAELLYRLLNTQVTVLKQKKQFSEFYHSDESVGLGEGGYLSGIVPLHLLMKVLGVRVVNNSRVSVGGVFSWKSPVTVRQHGIVIQRSSKETKIEFPSGYQITLPASESWQEVVDPSPVQKQNIPSKTMIPPDSHIESNKKVIIKLDQNSSDNK